VLIPEKVLDLLLIDGHTLGLSVVHGLVLVAVTVLHGEVFGLRNLCELLFESVFGHCVEVLRVLRLREEHMNERSLLILVKLGKERHNRLERLLVGLELLVAGLAVQVKNLDHLLEVLGVGVHCF
jgi:hypothetical protein